MEFLRTCVSALGITLGVALGLLAFGPAQAADKTVKLGLLTDLSGVFSDFSGRGSVVAAQLAIEDFKVGHPNLDAQLLIGDHQNKPDVGSAIVRQWIANNAIDAIIDVPNTSIALAINELARQSNKVLLISGAGSAELTGKQCSPNTIQWTFDTWSLAHALSQSLVAAGGDTWFFVVADYAFGHTLAHDVSVEAAKYGAKTVGEVAHPLGTADFSSYLLQAEASQAKVVGLADAGQDAINAIKAAAEFGLPARGQKIAGLMVFVTDIHAIGLPLAHGMQLASPFYWDLNDKTRAWSERFAARMGGARPSMIQAGVYASTLDYLRVVSAMDNPHDGRAVVAAMKAAPTDDDPFGQGSIRADGRKLHDMYVFQVKSSDESKAPWDLYKLVRRIPAAEAIRPLSESACPLLAAMGGR
jgi:branched-chain amino acid transport system substrate-binding protein